MMPLKASAKFEIPWHLFRVIGGSLPPFGPEFAS
jgi:hypothetical protein